MNTLIYSRHALTPEGNTPMKCALVDISIMKWTSPCCDLAYFLYTSVTPQLRRTHLEDLLGHYHDSLMKWLFKLGEDPTIYPYR